MRDLMKSTLHRVKTGWFWPLVVLVLPNCQFQVNGLGPIPNLVSGPLPHGDAVMCDIEKYQGPQRRCATQQDLMTGIALGSAAVALVAGQHSNVALDFSPGATGACNGQPQAIDLSGPFPDGYATCINCGAVIPATYPDATHVCIAECEDLVAAYPMGAPMPPDAVAFCTATAHPSTNFPKTGCFNGACLDAGTLRVDFADPRRNAEPVVWDDERGTSAAGNSLTKVAPSMGAFDAGAASDQWIFSGDGYVEFEASENNVSHVIGLSLVPMGCMHPADCIDNDPSIADINFAVSLNANTQYYVVENGQLVGSSHGTYMPGQRFRVTVKDQHDGTYNVEYSILSGACLPGNPCNQMVFATHSNAPATYPLRVDASFRETAATLANVTIVRIQ